MNWWKIVIGIVGVIGVAVQMPKDIGSWIVGLAFLILAIWGFTSDK